MVLLRRVLKFQALVWALFGLICLVSPGSVFLRLSGGGSTADVDALIRVLGVAAIILAMLMILVAQHPAETWWWAWAFVLLEAGAATVCVLRAVTGPDQAPTTPWWIAGLASAAFAAADLVALARAEQAKPFT